jgi:hypothetical protein
MLLNIRNKTYRSDGTDGKNWQARSWGKVLIPVTKVVEMWQKVRKRGKNRILQVAEIKLVPISVQASPTKSKGGVGSAEGRIVNEE